jgi:hypothetical protein
MGQILLASEEPQEWPALLRNMITDGSAQHRVAGFERVEYRALRDFSFDLKSNFDANLRQRSQMLRECDSDRHC